MTIDRSHVDLQWTSRVKVCLDCKRPFRISKEALEVTNFQYIVDCLSCVIGEEVLEERAGLVAGVEGPGKEGSHESQD